MRAVGAVIAGFVARFFFVMVAFGVLSAVLGVDRALAPGSFEVSPVWLIGSFLLGVSGAIAGGWVCARIAPGGAPLALATLVLVIGLLNAVVLLRPGADPRPTIRTPEMSYIVAMQNARIPTWATFVIPLIDSIGILIGARWGKK